MKRKVVAILSVLKPVDDTRNYAKMAASISNTNKYDINIIGFYSKKIPHHQGIFFYPNFNFGRTSLARITAPIKIWQKIIKVKPEVIIVTCAELLIVISIYKILFRCKFIYDIQENYYLNVRYSGAYQRWLKYPLAALLRLVEWISAPFIDYFFLAERVYADQLRFIGKRYSVLENKAISVTGNNAASRNSWSGGRLDLVYTGTISRHYGIFDAVHFAEQLRKADIDAHLQIVGFAPDKRFLEELKDEIKSKSFIVLTGGEELIPHDQIIAAQNKAHFCLLPYQQNKATEGRIPTRLYECLSREIPVIITPDRHWNSLINRYSAGIIHYFKSTVSQQIIEKLKDDFYTNRPCEEVLWISQEPSLLSALEKVL